MKNDLAPAMGVAPFTGIANAILEIEFVILAKKGATNTRTVNKNGGKNRS